MSTSTSDQKTKREDINYEVQRLKRNVEDKEKKIVELTTAEKKKIRIKKKEEADTERATKYKISVNYSSLVE